MRSYPMGQPRRSRRQFNPLLAAAAQRQASNSRKAKHTLPPVQPLGGKGELSERPEGNPLDEHFCRRQSKVSSWGAVRRFRAGTAKPGSMLADLDCPKRLSATLQDLLGVLRHERVGVAAQFWNPLHPHLLSDVEIVPFEAPQNRLRVARIQQPR